MQFVLHKLYSSQEEKVKRQVEIHVGEKILGNYSDNQSNSLTWKNPKG